MPFCPECKYEYVEGIAECADCRVPLVRTLEEAPQWGAGAQKNAPEWGASAHADDENPNAERPFCCWDARELMEANAACTILKGENIPCWVERSQRPIHSAYTREDTYPSSYYVLVPESQAHEARRILEHVMPNLEVDATDDIGAPMEEIDEDIINGGDIDEHIR